MSSSRSGSLWLLALPTSEEPHFDAPLFDCEQICARFPSIVELIHRKRIVSEVVQNQGAVTGDLGTQACLLPKYLSYIRINHLSPEVGCPCYYYY